METEEGGTEREEEGVVTEEEVRPFQRLKIILNAVVRARGGCAWGGGVRVLVRAA